MKGHNYGNIPCRKCGKIHIHPKGTKGKIGLWHHIEQTKQIISKKVSETRKRLGIAKGEKNPNWKGGTYLLDGYRYIHHPEHLNATEDGYIAKHRLVMEEKLGRYLNKEELVHHIDGNKLNNSPENLEIVNGTGRHFIDKHFKGRDKLGRFI
jgi:hypothetical protein